MVKIKELLLEVKQKKDYIKSIKKYAFILKDKKHIHFLIYFCFSKTNHYLSLLNFIITISAKKSNLFIHLLDCLGNELIFYSIYSINLSKKYSKEIEILQGYLKLILTSFSILKNKILVLHLININYNTNWFVEKLTQKLLVISIKQFMNFSFNGCRKKKYKFKRSG